MPTLSSSDIIVATVRLNRKGNPELLEGKHDLPHELHFHLTERMILECNSFIRARWQKSYNNIMQDLQDACNPKDPNPTF